MNVPDLLARVRHHGWDVRLTGGNPRFVKVEPDAGKLPAPLVDAFKRNRDAVLAWLSECPACGADTSDDETRERLAADIALCSRGFAKPCADMNQTSHEGSEPCPFRNNR